MFELHWAWKRGYYVFPYTKNNCMLMYPLPSLSCGERGLSGSRTLSQAGRLLKMSWGTLSVIEIWWQLEESNLSVREASKSVCSAEKRDFWGGGRGVASHCCPGRLQPHCSAVLELLPCLAPNGMGKAIMFHFIFFAADVQKMHFSPKKDSWAAKNLVNISIFVPLHRNGNYCSSVSLEALY